MNKYKFNSSQIIDKSKIDYEYNFSMTQIKSNAIFPIIQYSDYN